MQELLNQLLETAIETGWTVLRGVLTDLSTELVLRRLPAGKHLLKRCRRAQKEKTNSPMSALCLVTSSLHGGFPSCKSRLSSLGVTHSIC